MNAGEARAGRPASPCDKKNFSRRTFPWLGPCYAWPSNVGRQTMSRTAQPGDRTGQQCVAHD